MPEPETLLSYVEQHLACEKDLLGKKVLVTAGPTQEALDPVRYLTNHSTGKMGYAIAHAASLRGADVTLVSGPVSIAPPPFVKVIPITSAQDMFEVVSAHVERSDNGAQLVARTRTTANINGSDGTWNLQLVSQIHPDGTHFTKTVASLWS